MKLNSLPQFTTEIDGLDIHSIQGRSKHFAHKHSPSAKGNSIMNTTTLTEENTTTQPAKLLYTAKAHTTGGRDGGASRSSDGGLDVKLSIPGGPGNGTDPEQLFAAGWSACFLGAI